MNLLNPLNILFAWRYFKARKSTNAINIIAWVSISAIVIGTASLVLVLSVFNGFEGLVKSLYSSFYSDLKVGPVSGKTITLTAAQLQQLRSINGVKNCAAVVEENAFIQNDEYMQQVTLKAVDENYRYMTGVESHLVSGKFDLGTEESPKLIVGVGVEGALGIRADQNLYHLKIYLPHNNGGNPASVQEQISNDTIGTSAAFMIQQDFDNKYAFTNLAFARRALQLKPGEYSSAELALKDPASTDAVRKKIQKFLGDQYLVQDKFEQNRSLYTIMTVERWAIYGVLSLILVVAAFNMIGALTMLVLEKRKDISVLQALGASPGFIRKTFLSEGVLLAAIGAGAGMLIALAVAEIQIHHPFIPLQEGAFLIQYYPVELKWTDFLLVGGTVFVIALIASWIPARKAAAEGFTLRTE